MVSMFLLHGILLGFLYVFMVLNRSTWGSLHGFRVSGVRDVTLRACWARGHKYCIDFRVS